jgi:hypothetical protein
VALPLAVRYSVEDLHAGKRHEQRNACNKND